MAVKCPDCGAWHWKAERLTRSTNNIFKFGICCSSGRIQLPALPEPPDTLKNLLDSQDVVGKEFREHIHQYNFALAFTSLGVEMDESIVGRGPYVFKIHGELCHKHGSLIPEHGQTPRYAQLYIYDPSEALGYRQRNNRSSLASGTLNELQEMMQACNPFVPLYRQAVERLRDQPDGGLNL